MADKVNQILEYFDRTVEQYLSRDELRAKLRSGRKLRIKYGVDVTTPTLHIGHAVNLWLMRYMQDRGHKVIFVIGDFTTRIGDPDGRLETRPALPEEDIEGNIQKFIDQAKMVLRFDDPELIEVRRNSEWYKKMPLNEFMDLMSLVTHARLIARDMFQLRIAQNNEIYMQELIYPILQGYDSVVVESDLAIIGSDQLFNESIGRFLQEKFGKKPQTLATTVITPGIDGRQKQSKGLGNYVGLLHSPRDKFGRIMSIPDTLIDTYFRVYTDIPLKEIDDMKQLITRKPRDAKMKLAGAIVDRYHGHNIATMEREWFENTFSRGQIPDDLPTLALVNDTMEALDLVLLARPGKSNSDTRRFIKQGAVELNGEKLKDPDAELHLQTNDILKVGKRTWFRIEIVQLSSLETEHLIMEPLQLKDIDFISQYMPTWELVKHLGLAGPEDKKLSPKKARELLRKSIHKLEPRDEWLWKVARKARPGEDPAEVGRPIGVARLGRVQGYMADQKVWIRPDELISEEWILTEALFAVNEEAFRLLGINTLAFKSAFAFATAPREIEILRRSLRDMDTAQLFRDNPEGTVGFTKEGWQMMQEWRRMMSPWLFHNAKQQSWLGNVQQEKLDDKARPKSAFARPRPDQPKPGQPAPELPAGPEMKEDAPELEMPFPKPEKKAESEQKKAPLKPTTRNPFEIDPTVRPTGGGKK